MIRETIQDQFSQIRFLNEAIAQMRTKEENLSVADDLNTLFLLVKELESIQQTAKLNQNVLTALEITYQLLEASKQFLIDSETLVGLHGSLIYHDPVNLDLDLDFVVNKEHHRPAVLAFVRREIDPLFTATRVWPNMGNNRGVCDTNFSIINLNREVTQYAEILNQLHLDPELNLEVDYLTLNRIIEAEYIIYPHLALSKLFTMKLLYPSEQFELWKSLVMQVLEVIINDTYLLKMVIHNIQDVIRIREERSAKMLK